MKLQRQILAALRSQLAGGRTRAPEAGNIIWNTFAQLSRQRSWHAHGPNPISHHDIEAYLRIMRLPLEPRHISILIAMDQVWVEFTQAKATPGAKGQQVSKHPLTAELFDAMF